MKYSESTLRRQIVLQLLAILVLAIVLFPVLVIISMAINPCWPPTLIPQRVTLDAFKAIFTHPTLSPVTFIELARNSVILAVGVSALTAIIGTTAAYAFSRFKFPGRQAGLLGLIIVLIAPPVVMIPPLFVLIRTLLGPAVSDSIAGVGLAMMATSLPISIWTMKGFFDTIPKELEEAATIDGASPNQTFRLIMLPLALPGLAVTGLLGFIAGWTEFVLSWLFISNPKWFTLYMALYNLAHTVEYLHGAPPLWSAVAAMSIVVSIPVVIVFFALQKYIVSWLTLGGVKGWDDPRRYLSR